MFAHLVLHLAVRRDAAFAARYAAAMGKTPAATTPALAPCTVAEVAPVREALPLAA